MNGGETKIEQFNSMVRGLVTLLLTGGFIYGFLRGGLIDGGVYANIFGIAVAFWFASRQADKAEKAVADAAKPNGPPSTPGMTTTQTVETKTVPTQEVPNATPVVP